MSWVEIVYTGTPSSASGAVNETSPPFGSDSGVPPTRSTAKPRSATRLAGTRSSGQTTDISVSDHVTESSSPPAGVRAQMG